MSSICSFYLVVLLVFAERLNQARGGLDPNKDKPLSKLLPVPTLDKSDPAVQIHLTNAQIDENFDTYQSTANRWSAFDKVQIKPADEHELQVAEREMRESEAVLVESEYTVKKEEEKLVKLVKDATKGDTSEPAKAFLKALEPVLKIKPKITLAAGQTIKALEAAENAYSMIRQIEADHQEVKDWAALLSNQLRTTDGKKLKEVKADYSEVKKKLLNEPDLVSKVSVELHLATDNLQKLSYILQSLDKAVPSETKEQDTTKYTAAIVDLLKNVFTGPDYIGRHKAKAPEQVPTKEVEIQKLASGTNYAVLYALRSSKDLFDAVVKALDPKVDLGEPLKHDSDREVKLLNAAKLLKEAVKEIPAIFATLAVAKENTEKTAADLEVAVLVNSEGTADEKVKTAKERFRARNSEPLATNRGKYAIQKAYFESAKASTAKDFKAAKPGDKKETPQVALDAILLTEREVLIPAIFTLLANCLVESVFTTKSLGQLMCGPAKQNALEACVMKQPIEHAKDVWTQYTKRMEKGNCCSEQNLKRTEMQMKVAEAVKNFQDDLFGGLPEKFLSQAMQPYFDKCLNKGSFQSRCKFGKHV